MAWFLFWSNRMCQHKHTVIHDDLSSECLDCGKMVPNPITEDIQWFTVAVIAGVVLAGLTILSLAM